MQRGCSASGATLPFYLLIAVAVFVNSNSASGVNSAELSCFLSTANELYFSAPGQPQFNISDVLGDAFADASLFLSVFNSSFGYLKLVVNQSGFQNITGIGIYNAPSDANAAMASILFNHSDSSYLSVPLVLNATISLILMDSIFSSPQAYYAQILTQLFPLGAGRGQLVDNTVSNGIGVSPENILIGNLTGGKVYPVSNPSIFYWADFTGFIATSNPTNATKDLFFILSISQFLENVTSASTHKGNANSTGAVVIDLLPAIRLPSLNANRAFKGTLPVDASVIDSILTLPELYYIQLNSIHRPEGAVRSQLVTGRGLGQAPPSQTPPSPLFLPNSGLPPPVSLPASANSTLPPPQHSSVHRQASSLAGTFRILCFLTLLAVQLPFC